MLQRKYTKEAYEEFHVAIANDDLEKVKELVEQDKVAITNIECIKVVRLNRLLLLKYFLAKSTNLIGALAYALDEAVRQKNYEAISLLVTYFRDNKERYVHSDLSF